MNKIRIGLLIDDFVVPHWAHEMVKTIHGSGYADVVLVVKKKTPSAPKKSFFSRLKNSLGILLYVIYRRMENALFKQKHDVFAPKDMRDFLNTADVLEVECEEKKFSDFVSEEDVEKIRNYQVDVMVRLGFRILRGSILKSAKLGIWSYHHGDNFLFRGGPAGFWEVIRKERELGSVLQILTEDLDGGEVLYRSWSTVHTSLNETLNSFYWKTATFIPRKLKELHEKGETAFLQKVKEENSQLHFYSKELYTIPGNWRFAGLFLSYFFRWIGRSIWKMFHMEQWILLYSFDKSKSFSTSIFRYKRITPPRDRYWADPCVVYEDGKHYVFLEEVEYKKRGEKGHISVAVLGSKGFESAPRIILDKPYHLSYPFVFKYENEYYLIPESEQNATIELYKAVKFPYEWEFKMNLMENVKAVDTTVFQKDGKVWLLTNIREMEGGPYSEELFVFSANSLLTNQWEPHPANPVVSDVKSARPAGRIFSHHGKLYRPSQDCSYRYGYATVLNEIVELNENEYKERKVSVINPNWAKDVVGTHTLSFDNGLSVIDASVKRRKFF